MFSSIASVVTRRRKSLAVAWLVIFVLGMALAGPTMGRLRADLTGATGEAARVADRIVELTHDGQEVVAIVGDTPVDDAALRASVERARADLLSIPHVQEVIDWYGTGVPSLRSRDGTATLMVVGLDHDVDTREQVETTKAVTERLRQIDAARVEIGGSAVINEEFQKAVEKDLQRGETTALPIALVAMIIIFGGLVAAGLPLIIAFSAVAASMLVLFVTTSFMDMSVYATNVIFMLGIGLGIDYGLLIVSRFREERAGGHDVHDAVRRTVVTAGRTVVFSALTVAVALAGLFAFGSPVFTSFGIAGMAVVLLAMTSALTLLPALLAMWGGRIRTAKARREDHGWFHGVATFVQRRAALVVVVVAAGLMLFAAPFLGARFAEGDARYLPRGSEARAVAIELMEKFPGRGADPLYVVANVDAASPALATYVAEVRGTQGVTDVRVWPQTPAGTSIIEVVPQGTSQGPVAQSLARTLRNATPPFATEVGGTAAFLIDTKHTVTSRLPLAFAIIAIATFVLLFLMTGSIAVPIKAIVMNVLSLGASFGALVWVFQEGHLSGLLGFDSVGTIDLFMPVLIFIFAFGLSMDYEVFLLSRIKEVHDETGNNDLAVAVGLQRTGKIITSAAFLIVVVFAGFASGQVLGIKELGFGMALAVIVDATIVRTLLVPATMRLLGEWNWWAPAPLRRFHQRFGLHEAPSQVRPALTPEVVPS